MSVLVSTAYMDEADRFDWLIAMDAGRILAAGTSGELKQRTGTENREETFVALLPERKRGTGRRLTIVPRVETDAETAIVAKKLTPIERQPLWMHRLTPVLPSRHFVAFSQAIIYRGAGVDTVWPQFLAVTGIGLAFFVMSLRLFRESIAVTR